MSRVSLWLEQLAENFQLAEQTRFRLDLVLNEALANIISYAYHDSLVHEIELKLTNSPQQLVLEIMDDGMPFNPFVGEPYQEKANLESALPNGRGIHMIKSYTDSHEYRYCQRLNIMRLTFDKSSGLACAADA